MARNIEISTIEKDKQTIISSSTLGITSENLQGKIIFKPEPFIEGTCRMYIEGRGSILMEKQEDCYTLDILSSLLTESSLDICFKITEPENEKGIPIFCSKIIKLKVLETIDSDETIPEQYPTWIEIFDSKIAELEELEADFEEAEEDRNQAVQDAIENIEEATAGVENLNVDVSDKVAGDVSITLTKKNGVTKTVVLSDGTSLMFHWDGTRLGIKTDKDEEYVYVDLKGAKGDTGPRGEPGAIKFIIVQTLPTTDIEQDAMYLVPITPDESDNNYAEYIYVDGTWEQLGKIAVHVDLSDYVKNTDYATTQKTGVIKLSSDVATQGNAATGVMSAITKTYEQYTSAGNAMFIGKGTLENVLNEKIGNIESILETLDTGSGV